MRADSDGFFCYPPRAKIPGEGCVVTNVDLLGIRIDRMEIGPRKDEWQLMELRFAAPLNLETIDAFLLELADAITVEMAPEQLDGYNGNYHAVVRLPLLEVIDPSTPPDTLVIVDAISITRTQGVSLYADMLEKLTFSPLGRIFAEGVRSADPKMKYISWFVVLEELEGRSEFAFDPLFSMTEVEHIIKASALNQDQTSRLRGALTGRSVTVKGRPEKLAEILTQIGMPTIKTIKGPITVTVDLCRALIKQRNTVAHKGTDIDNDLLHNALFPLAIGALAYIEGRPLPDRPTV
ncbi:hypothetical protein AX777_25400 [Sphingobium yanoikuyae]|uniref:ApeA N-terminal domain-containing protein n=1 Tax=Sphingobium yanoikuyae TaxID=13690 RepID=A0A177JP71_SPHYA|nr:hypothetical protein AX777_25400 [Sphingobium yanoikuyae]